MNIRIAPFFGQRPRIERRLLGSNLPGKVYSLGVPAPQTAHRVKASEGRLTMDKDRADRLEQKIDELTKAVVTLAKVEEKVHGMTRRVGSVEEDCRALYRKIDLLVTEMHTLAIGIKPGLAMSDGFRRTTTTIFVATFAAIAGAVVSFLLLK